MLAVVEQAAVPRSAEQVKDVRRLHAAEHREPKLSVGGKDPILRLQRVRGAHLRAFLPEHRRVHAELSLSLEVCRFLVDPAREDHHAVDLAEVFLFEIEVVAVIGHERAVRLQDLNGFGRDGAGVDEALHRFLLARRDRRRTLIVSNEARVCRSYVSWSQRRSVDVNESTVTSVRGPLPGADRAGEGVSPSLVYPLGTCAQALRERATDARSRTSSLRARATDRA